MNSICHKPQTANTNKAVLAPHGPCLALPEGLASGGTRNRIDDFVHRAVGLLVAVECPAHAYPSAAANRAIRGIAR